MFFFFAFLLTHMTKVDANLSVSISTETKGEHVQEAKAG